MLNITLEELKIALFREEIKQVIQQAYFLGVEEARSKYNYPYLLTKQHLSEIFQVKESTVNKIVARSDFPKSNFVSGRYPRDEVFRWIEKNCRNIEGVINNE